MSLDRPIRCIECYKTRPGGRCEFCPLHKKNRSKYTSVGEGWFIQREDLKDEDMEGGNR
jgi:hypothetical protein